jgi:hypothetical protein
MRRQAAGVASSVPDVWQVVNEQQVENQKAVSTESAGQRSMKKENHNVATAYRFDIGIGAWWRFLRP